MSSKLDFMGMRLRSRIARRCGHPSRYGRTLSIVGVNPHDLRTKPRPAHCSFRSHGAASRRRRGETSCGRPGRRGDFRNTVENKLVLRQPAGRAAQPVGVNQSTSNWVGPASTEACNAAARVENKAPCSDGAKTSPSLAKRCPRVQFYQHIVFGVGMGRRIPPNN